MSFYLPILSTFELEKSNGTNQVQWKLFLDKAIAALPVPDGNLVEAKVFLFDNLASHLTSLCLDTILLSGHRFVARPAYDPQDAPIEYIFNTIGNELKLASSEITDDESLRAVVLRIVTNLDTASFVNYFEHCGY